MYTKATTDLSAPDALKALARPEVLRVKEIRESGVMILPGRDGAVIEENVVNCAPCHLPIVNPVIDWGYYKVPLNLPCRVCNSPAGEASMLICDGCQSGWHKGCLNPR